MNREKKTYRFNFVMSYSMLYKLYLLQEYQNTLKSSGRGATKAEVVRRLINEEVQRLKLETV